MNKIEKEGLEKKKSDEKKTKAQKVQKGKGKMKSFPVQRLPYMHAPTMKDNVMHYARFLDIFSRLQINIPFSKALEQTSTYAKFMKDILTKKKRYTDQETINLDASCSAIIQRTIPRKEIDPGRVTLLVTIGNVKIIKALVYLGSSINLISLFMV